MQNRDNMLWLFLGALGLFILCTLGAHLGWNNYSREGMTSDAVVFTAPDGSTAVIVDGEVVVTNDSGDTTYRLVKGEKNVYTSSSGGKVIVKTASGSEGGNAISIAVTDGDGNASVVYAAEGPKGNKTGGSASTNYDNYNHYNGSSMPTIFYGPDGGTAKIIVTDGNDTIVITSKNGQSTTYYVDDADVDTYVGKNGGKIVVVTNNGNTTLSVTTPDGDVYVYTDTNSYSYNEAGTSYEESDMPGTHVYVGDDVAAVQGPGGNTAVKGPNDNVAIVNDPDGGIPRSAIPAGDEDLYMLKSQALVPICPKCEPVVITKSDCQPCPAPARCPEPQFECTKTFTSKAFNPAYAPMPVMSDFSSFGM